MFLGLMLALLVKKVSFQAYILHFSEDRAQGKKRERELNIPLGINKDLTFRYVKSSANGEKENSTKAKA